MKAILEFVIRVLKWLPRPLVPFVPILLGPVPLFMVIVYVHVHHGEQVSSSSSQVPNGNRVASSPASVSRSQTTTLERPMSTAISNMSSQSAK